MIAMVTCWWSARRLDRYLDADPGAPLAPHEVRRLERHLSVCARCRRAADDRRRVRAALRSLTARRTPDPASVRRLEDFAARLRDDDPSDDPSNETRTR